ncbi:hypothetical protein F5Y13DRAFT_32801 [Hypoxylon sp. FL1857]|nr:hypothetical protein F5Y13DRAFT_32801 [Hypoxylon sp. FL1857]
MANLALAFPLLLIALTALAIYVQVTSSTLSLPISTGTTVLTIILPFLAAANVFYTPLLQRYLGNRVRSAALQQLSPVALQVIQGVLTVVLATLTAQGFVPGQLLECSLEGHWMRMWKDKDGRAIERIQDAFNCCGFRSIKDHDWPAPVPGPPTPPRCRTLYPGRHDACLAPWRASMQRSAGLEFTVVVAVGILQLIHLALFRLRNSGGARARGGYRRLVQSVGADPRQGLLENGTTEVAQAEEGDGAAGEDGANGNRQGYGTVEDGPSHRLEPSGLGEDGNNWR